MRLDHGKPVRKVGQPCALCGREFWAGKRKGRRREFCSNTCRQAAFRNASYYPTGRYEIAQNNPDKSIACKPVFGDRGAAFSVPVNLLGGYRWPGATPVDRATLEKIIHREIGGTEWIPPVPEANK